MDTGRRRCAEANDVAAISRASASTRYRLRMIRGGLCPGGTQAAPHEHDGSRYRFCRDCRQKQSAKASAWYARNIVYARVMKRLRDHRRRTA